ncbi:MAG: helix-turn-helix domain-containing protein [Muribaculaceae bacterium]|nr:helix-turn-helix domain-containing protein [Muribaculaceae bacterium]
MHLNLTQEDKENLKKIKFQRDRILYCLEKYGSITVNDCFYALGIAAAPRRIKDLKDKHNIPIESVSKKGKNRWGDKNVPYVEYTLDFDKYKDFKFFGGKYA